MEATELSQNGLEFTFQCGHDALGPEANFPKPQIYYFYVFMSFKDFLHLYDFAYLLTFIVLGRDFQFWDFDRFGCISNYNIT